MTHGLWLAVVGLAAGLAAWTPARHEQGRADRQPAQPGDRTPRRPDPAQPPGRDGLPDGPWIHQLHFATSDDGISWREAPEPGLRRASSPDLIELPAKEQGGLPTLAAFFVDASGLSGPGPTRLARSESADNGATWSDPRPLELNGLPSGVDATDPSVVILPDGKWRMYFTLSPRARPDDRRPDRDPPTLPNLPRIPIPDPPGRPPGQRPPAPEPSVPQPPPIVEIRSAVSDDGVRFVTEAGSRWSGPGVGDAEVVRVGDEWLMFFGAGGEVRLARGSDGLAFKEDELFVLRGGDAPGVALVPGGRVRVYLTGSEGVSSVVYDPATGSVEREAGVRLRGPCADPDVWSIPRGGYAMLVRRYSGTPRQGPPNRGSPARPGTGGRG